MVTSASAAAAWKPFSIKTDPVLIAEPSVLERWTGKAPLGAGWVLHYWGHPLCEQLPAHLQPNGTVGHQYLACEDDAAVAARYAELCAVLRRVAPKLKIAGP